MITLYGITNCDTTRKARRCLEERGIDHRFHDLRRDGIEAGRLRAWCREFGWETLLNRRGTTWRRLPERDRSGLNEARAVALMLAHPTVIRRPILEAGRLSLLGFDEARYRELPGSHR